MGDILILLVLVVYAVCGYHLMGRLDHFMNTRIQNEEEDSGK